MAPAKPAEELPVWDPVVRAGHWALVCAVALAWLTRKGWGAWHEWIGYAALALVALRIAWGFLGSRYARFEQFVRPPGATLSYARRVLRREEPRFVGHNPLGGWMTLLLLASVALASASGWLYVTDAFWGEEWLEDLHEFLATAVLGLAALHVCGVVFTSLRHRENLVASMLHGRKRAPSEDDVS